MNGILGFADLLKEPSLTGEEQQKYIGIIQKSGERMLNIINDIVSISKIESGQMEIDIQESNINKQIEFIYTFFKPEIEGKGMQLSFSNSLPSSEAILKTDREKVYAILTNLVKNAIKYSEKGAIEFGYNLKGKYLEFYVKDTGIGIPKDRQKDIFERFIQADLLDEMARQGAGLGLSISKAYIEMLGGKIWVESKLGEGSTFYFTLPYKSETTKGNSTENEILSPVKENPINKLKILIVEDDETSEKLISITVQKFSKEIISVRTGTEAVSACLKNSDIDLVLMDIQLPKMDGYEATREIRKFNKDLIIVAQTAYALNGDKEKALEAGCNDYISKPINEKLLSEIIIKYIGD
jgi:CheY-like chemotaxis protein